MYVRIAAQTDNNESNINNSELDKGPFGRLLSALGVCVLGRVIASVCACVPGFPSRLCLGRCFGRFLSTNHVGVILARVS